MTKGKHTLIQKDPKKRSASNDYRPITYLPIMWKMLQGRVSWLWDMTMLGKYDNVENANGSNFGEVLRFANKMQTVPRGTERLPQVDQRYRRSTIY